MPATCPAQDWDPMDPTDFTTVGETVKTAWPTNAYLSIPLSAQPRRPTETAVSDSGIELGQPCSA